MERLRSTGVLFYISFDVHVYANDKLHETRRRCVCMCADCWRRQRCRDYRRNYFYSIYDDIVHSYSSRRMCRRISDSLPT